MIDRRHVLLLPFAGMVAGAAPVLRFGVVTDVHHAEKDPLGSRHYRTAHGRLEKAVADFNRRGVSFAVELGDLVDEAPQLEREIGYLREINTVFSRVKAPRHYVLGNHCVFNLTKREFLATVGRRRSYYAFDQGGIHFIVLDACCRKDGVDYGRRNYDWTDTFLPPRQVEWLAKDLKSNRRPTLVFVHQRLDREDNYGVKNSPQIREMLESSRQVKAVFQGHSHENDYQPVNGIHYVTFCATVERPDPEGGAYALVEIRREGVLQIEGLGRQVSRDLNPHG